MYKIVLFLIVWLFFDGCGSGIVNKNGYLMPPKIDTSSITMNQILKHDKSELSKGIINIDSVIDAKVAKEVNLKLRYLDGKVDNINLYVNTRGGWLKDTFSIIDTMHSISTPVNVYAKGLCQSAGVMILINATGKRYAFKDAKIVPHFNRPSKPTINTQAYFDNQKFENMWRNKTNIPASWYPLTGNRLIRLTPQDAKNNGIIDEVIN